MDLYKKYINNINKKLPKDFDYKTYLDLNPDIIEHLIDKDIVSQHYLKIGIQQNRRYKKEKLDKDFDEVFYSTEYPDSLDYDKNNKEISLKKRLFAHYNFHGKKEGRFKNTKEKHSFIFNFKDLKYTELKHFKNNLDCICLLTTNKEIEDGRCDEFIKHLVSKTKKIKKIDFKIIINNNSIKNPDLKKLKTLFDSVEIVNLKLSKKNDIYTNNKPVLMPKYGLKSGPNLTFFNTIKLCNKYNTTLMLETDCILNTNWINDIYNYVKYSNGFLVSGAINDGSSFSKSNSSILNHINGGTGIYATGNIILQKLIKILALFIEDQTQKNNPGLAYDYALKLLIDINIDNIEADINTKNIWKFINRNYVQNNLIFNYSLLQDACVDKDIINKKYNYAVLHKKEL